MFDFLIVYIIGLIIGFYAEKISIFLINKRTENKHLFINKNAIIFALVNSLFWILIFIKNGINTLSFIYAFSILACISLSYIDIKIKKIPNSILVFLLILATVNIFLNNGFKNIGINLIGLLTGFVVFFAPALIGKGAGFGDIKLAAVIGYFLGFYNFITSIAIMSIFLIIYFIYIVITKKGGLKTKIPFGPFLSIGFILFLLINNSI